MKKVWFYLMPFLLIPGVTLLLEELSSHGNRYDDNLRYLYPVLLCLISVGIALFSPSHHRFDYWLVGLMPVALLVTLFSVGVYNNYCIPTTPDVTDLARVCFQPLAWLNYALLALTALTASYRRFRISSRLKNNRIHV